MTADWRHLFPFSPNHLDLDGHRLHYVDEGPRHGRPVLFVHGNPTWSFAWRACISAVRETRRAIAPDHLGCGLSDKPKDGPYRLADRIAALERLVLALDLRDVTLVVHDWGGAIGFGMAARHPDRIGRLVVTNTAAFRSRHMPWRIAAARVPGLGALAVRGLNGFSAAAMRMATAKGLGADVTQGYLAPYDSWAHREAVLRFVEDIPTQHNHPSWPTLLDVEAGLAQFADRPAVIAWGELDWCFTPSYREEWQRRLPGAAVHRYEDAGHLLMEDAQDRLVSLIAGFA